MVSFTVVLEALELQQATTAAFSPHHVALLPLQVFLDQDLTPGSFASLPLPQTHRTVLQLWPSEEEQEKEKAFSRSSLMVHPSLLPQSPGRVQEVFGLSFQPSPSLLLISLSFFILRSLSHSL